MIVGYARVSTEEQKLDLQLQALRSVGCNRIYQDHGYSGIRFDRDGLEAALESLKPKGTFVVWRLDRLGRSLTGLVHLIDRLGQREVQFRSIMESIDTHSAGGRLMFHMMAALAEFERSLISERTRAGLVEAKARGAAIGRPSLVKDTDLRDAMLALQRGGARMNSMAAELGVSTRTLRRHLSGRRDALMQGAPT